MLKLLSFVLCASLLLACGEPSDADTTTSHSAELGSVSLAVETSTATHTYRVNGTLQVWRAGVQLQTVDISGSAPTVLIDDLAPGNYDLFLNWGGSILRDGAPYAASLVGANPWPVTVAADETTNTTLAFNVVGDPPVVFELGAISVDLDVNEVPPAP